MKTIADYSIFGVFIPKGTEIIEGENCAHLVRYDETKGCRFDKKAKYIRPKHNQLIPIERSNPSIPPEFN